MAHHNESGELVVKPIGQIGKRLIVTDQGVIVKHFGGGTTEILFAAITSIRQGFRMPGLGHHHGSRTFAITPHGGKEIEVGRFFNDDLDRVMVAIEVGRSREDAK